MAGSRAKYLKAIKARMWKASANKRRTKNVKPMTDEESKALIDEYLKDHEVEVLPPGHAAGDIED